MALTVVGGRKDAGLHRGVERQRSKCWFERDFEAGLIGLGSHLKVRDKDT